MISQVPLEEKVRRALTRLARVRERWRGCAPQGPDPVRVAWTGGKDSTVVLHLWRRVLAGEDGAGDGGARADSVDGACAPAALNLDTGHKFPEIVAFRDRLAVEWNVDLFVARPTGAAALPDYPVARDVVACCRDLKILPLAAALRELRVAALLTGVRADEHPERAARGWVERGRLPGGPRHVRVNPILEFTEMDVWAYHMQERLPYCTLYDRGYRSLGCAPCTAPPDDPHAGAGQGERAGRNAAKERNLHLLRSLGYF
ncbi:MAG: phosphoadenosine phosphosulfate reductase family protein [Desulfovibrionaceae bacterium]|jgi:phosphoadenosine phosphosulfate reductase|nr:phosphoadenosine phosphosulfate reductase family protein [Desulfovibrionaceae bacterium]